MNASQNKSLEISSSPGIDQSQFIRKHIQAFLELKDKYYWICFSSLIYFGFRILMWVISMDNARHGNGNYDFREIICAAFGLGTSIVNLLLNKRNSQRLKYASTIMNILLLIVFMFALWPAVSAAAGLNCDLEDTSLQAQCYRQRWGLVMTLIVDLAGLLITIFLIIYSCRLLSLGEQIKSLTGDEENIIPNAFVPLEEDEEENA